MKRYFKNVIIALMGSDPYQQELDGWKEKYEKASARITSQQLWINRLVDRWEESRKEAHSCQSLIEHQRQRIKELKASLQESRELTGRVKKEYQQRIEKYNAMLGEIK